MAEPARDAVITGLGIVSCLGEGPQSHWQALNAGQMRADAMTIPPYVIHPMAALDLDRQIPKKGDQRQMESWQRIGVYAAGLALDAAQLKGKPELLGRTDMIVAAGGGERDYAVDSAILSAQGQAASPDRRGPSWVRRPRASMPCASLWPASAPARARSCWSAAA
jgi:3-oxoacyl-[acyl-carrier-protein] synthase II